MSLDRHAAERRRFARLLGIDGELGSGLPIGARSSRAEEENDRDRGESTDDRSGEESASATRSRDRRGTS